MDAITDTLRRRTRRESPMVRRKDLLDATVTCLARLGPRGATGREICRQAGVSHGLIRHYFRNPQNLLFETYEQLCDDMLAHVEGAVEPCLGDPWFALDAFFEAAFADDWASPDIIGAWMVFWQQVRTRDDFAAVSHAFNMRQRALLERIALRLPPRPGGMPLADAIAILSAVLDGLWIEHYLSDTRTPRRRCIDLCNAAARRLFDG